MPRLSILAAVAVATLASSACASHEAKNPPPDAPPVAVAVVSAHTEPLDVLYRASGTVRGRSTAVITSKTTGYVRDVKVRPGDRVVTGQLLALLEAKDSAASARRAGAGLDTASQTKGEAEHALEAARIAATIAKTTRDRVAALAAGGSVSKQQLDDADAQWRAAVAQEQVAEARLRSAASRIAQAGAEVAEAMTMLDYAKITAPFDGRVIERRIDPGSMASPGVVLLVVEDDVRLRVEASVGESFAAAIVMGDQATVTTDALPQPLPARVTEIVPSIEAGSRAFIVKVDLPDGVTGLRAGMFARAAFKVGTRPRLVVPKGAVTSLGALDRVLVVEGDRARLRMITVGDAQDAWVEVLSGLEAGERVVATPAMLKDGARVAVAP